MELVVALATALAAVVGLVVSVILNYLDRLEARRNLERKSLHEAADLLGSEDPARRAIGVARAADHLSDDTLRTTALRITINALHYEAEPLIIGRALDAISEERLAPAALEDLLRLNRRMWRSVLDRFAQAVSSPQEDRNDRIGEIESIMGQLRLNQRIVSRLLAANEGEARGLDFGDTFLPGMTVPGVTFVDCEFRAAFLHYANLSDTRFFNCAMDETILIGSYLEGISFADCSFEQSIAIAARLHRTSDESHDRLPASLVENALLNCPSFLCVFEEDWKGHWLAELDSNLLKASWWDTHNSQVDATLERIEDGFIRKNSTDRNDGHYEVAANYSIDTQRRVALVGGRRVLASGIPSAWLGVWWRQLPGRGGPVNALT